MAASAQESLAGRTYYCGNLMEKELGQMKKEVASVGKEAKTEEEKQNHSKRQEGHQDL